MPCIHSFPLNWSCQREKIWEIDHKKISNSKTIEINGRVEADIKSEKITLGKTASFDGGIQADLVVISGKYQGKLKADSVWLTDTSIITGEINYKNIFKYIHKRNFNGILGMEHGNSRPDKAGELAVIEAYKFVDSFI